MVEPDIIAMQDRPPRRRPGWALPAAVMAGVGLAVVVIGSNARQPAPRPTPPAPFPTPTAEPIDFDTLVEGGHCTGVARTERQLSYLFGVANSGHQPLDILSFGRPAAGLQLITTGLPTGCENDRAALPFSPFRLAPGESRLVLLRFRITDCAVAASSDRVPVTVTVRYVDGSVRRSRVGLPARAAGPCG